MLDQGFTRKEAVAGLEINAQMLGRWIKESKDEDGQAFGVMGNCPHIRRKSKGSRQNQKTGKNDALAIVQASQLVDIKFINGKTFEQQELQSIMRMRELTVKHKVALRNEIEALLLEFNIRVSSRRGEL